MAASAFCSGFHFLMGGVRLTKFDIVFNGIVKKIHILKDHADIFQNTICSIVFDIFSANPNSAALYIPKSGD